MKYFEKLSSITFSSEGDVSRSSTIPFFTSSIYQASHLSLCQQFSEISHLILMIILRFCILYKYYTLNRRMQRQKINKKPSVFVQEGIYTKVHNLHQFLLGKRVDFHIYLDISCGLAELLILSSLMNILDFYHRKEEDISILRDHMASKPKNEIHYTHRPADAKMLLSVDFLEAFRFDYQYRKVFRIQATFIMLVLHAPLSFHKYGYLNKPYIIQKFWISKIQPFTVRPIINQGSQCHECITMRSFFGFLPAKSTENHFQSFLYSIFAISAQLVPAEQFCYSAIIIIIFISHIFRLSFEKPRMRNIQGVI